MTEYAMGITGNEHEDASPRYNDEHGLGNLKTIINLLKEMEKETKL